MSGEFGSYYSGYFDSQIKYATDDLRGGELATTRLWAKFFEELQPVAGAIAYAEASDTSEAHAIVTIVQQMPRLKQALDEIDKAMSTYREAMETAVRNAMEAHR